MRQYPFTNERGRIIEAVRIGKVTMIGRCALDWEPVLITYDVYRLPTGEIRFDSIGLYGHPDHLEHMEKVAEQRRTTSRDKGEAP
jgi:hypothetical protein